MRLNQHIELIQPQVFDKLLKYGKRWNPERDVIKKIKTKPLLLYYSYKFVKETLPSYLTSGNIEELLIDLGIKKPHKLKAQEVIPLVLWFIDEIKSISKLEKDYLSTPPDAEMLSAGIETLNELGEWATVDMLVITWMGAYTHEEIWNMPYHEVFNKQREMKLRGDIQKKLAKIQLDKSKRKK